MDEAREAVALVQRPLWPRQLLSSSCSAMVACPSWSSVNEQTGRRWPQEFGLRCVATNDVHYVRQEDASSAGAAAGHADPDDHL